MGKVLVLLFAVVLASYAEPITSMTRVSVINVTPLSDEEKEKPQTRQEVTFYTAGDVLGRVEVGASTNGKPLVVTIYNDGDMWVYSGVTMKGVYERDPEESHSFHATIFPTPALLSLEFGKEAAFLAKQQVTQGSESLDNVACMYREASVGDLKVRLYSRQDNRQPAFVELWSEGKVAMRFKYTSYAAQLPFNKSLFEKPEGVLVLNDDGAIPPPEGKLTLLGQRWAMACGAVLDSLNGDRHDVLGGVARTEKSKASGITSLKRWWGVSSKEDLLEKLDWLMTEGHRNEYIGMGMQVCAMSDADYNELIQKAAVDGKALSKITLVKENFNKTGRNTLRGWDYARYVNLCGWGYKAGYLSEQEAFDLMVPAVNRIQQSFGSWKEFGQNFVLGREFWSGDKAKSAEAQQACNKLLADPNSPWVKLKWNTELLGKEEVPAGK